MDSNFQYRIGFTRRPFDTVKKRFIKPYGTHSNMQLGWYNSINFTVVQYEADDFGNCVSVNCTGLISLIQNDKIDFGERLYSYTAIADSTPGLKPGPVGNDVTCTIASTLPEIGIIREDVLKSLSVFRLNLIILLAILYLLLFCTPFLLWFLKYKFNDIKIVSPPIIWPLICSLLRQGTCLRSLFYQHTLHFIWLSITLTLFFITTLYSSSFTTDLSFKGAVETIDTLEDVAASDKMPIWREEQLCRAVIERGSYRVRREILRRGKYQALSMLFKKEPDLEKVIFINTRGELARFRFCHCVVHVNETMLKWHQSVDTFPAFLLFSVWNSKLPFQATKVISRLYQKIFESGLDARKNFLISFFYVNLIDPQLKTGCYSKAFITPEPLKYKFNQLSIHNYRLFFKYFAYMIPICILCLIGEHLYFWICSIMYQ